MIAQVTGYEIGSLTFNINDCHVYDRHIEPLKEQINLKPYEAPKLWLNPEITNFDDFTISDFELVSPSLSDSFITKASKEEIQSFKWYNHHPTISLEVAI
jgi:thymidylate synthase